MLRFTFSLRICPKPWRPCRARRCSKSWSFTWQLGWLNDFPNTHRTPPQTLTNRCLEVSHASCFAYKDVQIPSVPWFALRFHSCNSLECPMKQPLVCPEEACESGSMFPDLKDDGKILAVTASNAKALQVDTIQNDLSCLGMNG